ncbi:hypothetical protein BH09MYX1_BH09MYX1_47200 [soil metagenome]
MARRSFTATWCVLILVILAACGGLTESQTLPDAGTTLVADAAPKHDTGDAARSACEAFSARCGAGTLNCARYECLRIHREPQLIALYEQCLSSAACTDTCRSAYSAFFGTDSTAAQLRSECLAASASCPSAIYWWWCDDLGAIDATHRADLKDCLGSTCGDLSKCARALSSCLL